MSARARLQVVVLLPCLLLGGCVLGPLDEPWESPSSSEPVRSEGPMVAAPGEAERVRQRQRETLIASGSVPLSVADLGFYLDVQEGRLRQDLGAAGASVHRRGERILLRFPEGLAFAPDSDELSEAVRPLLDSVAEILAEYDRSLVTLYGHTDDSGSADYNQALSQRRAAAVAAFLESRGVAPARLLVVGLGEAQPLADNASEEGRGLNRRVEILLEPLTGGDGRGAEPKGG